MYSHVCLQLKWDHKVMFLKKHTAAIKSVENWIAVLKNAFKDQKESICLWLVWFILSSTQEPPTTASFLRCAFMKYMHTYGCRVQDILMTESYYCFKQMQAIQTWKTVKQTNKKRAVQIMNDFVVSPWLLRLIMLHPTQLRERQHLSF